MITRFYINTRSATSHLVIDRETDQTVGTHRSRVEAQKQRDQLSAAWNPETRTTTITKEAK